MGLKTKGNTPKYGLIFHSTFIGRAQQKNKGRISRYLANKCSIASRIDCFSDETKKIGIISVIFPGMFKEATTVFGEKLRDQVEERLAFLTEGTTPRENLEVMQEAIKEVKKRRKKKKRKEEAKEEAVAEGEVLEEGVAKAKKKKKAKVAKGTEADEEEAPPVLPVQKTKKKRKEAAEEAIQEAAEEAPVEEEDVP